MIKLKCKTYTVNPFIEHWYIRLLNYIRKCLAPWKIMDYYDNSKEDIKNEA